MRVHECQEDTYEGVRGSTIRKSLGLVCKVSKTGAGAVPGCLVSALGITRAGVKAVRVQGLHTGRSGEDYGL